MYLRKIKKISDTILKHISHALELINTLATLYFAYGLLSDTPNYKLLFIVVFGFFIIIWVNQKRILLRMDLDGEFKNQE